MNDQDPARLDELLQAGDATLELAVRRVHDAAFLGDFAARWFQNTGAQARAGLLAYVEGPLNSFRHEALVKRLFKLAETAGDDELMARFVVAFDRSLCRETRRQFRTLARVFEDEDEAEACASAWREQGFRSVWTMRVSPTQLAVRATRVEVTARVARGSTMPRDRMVKTWAFDPSVSRYTRSVAPEWAVRLRLVGLGIARPFIQVDPADHLEALSRFHLFSASTRHYLRRRAWRYFRRLARQDAARYVRACAEALVHYTDADTDSKVKLLDRYALVHMLFHDHKALMCTPAGWIATQEWESNDLAPAPYRGEAWRESTEALVRIIGRARSCRVRQWALTLLQGGPETGATVPSPLGWGSQRLDGADPLLCRALSEWTTVPDRERGMPAGRGFLNGRKALVDPEVWNIVLQACWNDIESKVVPLLSSLMFRARRRSEPAIAVRRLNGERLQSFWNRVMADPGHTVKLKLLVVDQVRQRLLSEPAEAAGLVAVLKLALGAGSKAVRDRALSALLWSAEVQPPLAGHARQAIAELK